MSYITGLTVSYVFSHMSEKEKTPKHNCQTTRTFLCPKKKDATKLCQILTDLKNSFTDRLSRKFDMQRYVDIPPHLTYVATLPCETRISEKNLRNSPCSKSRYIRHKIMANCHF